MLVFLETSWTRCRMTNLYGYCTSLESCVTTQYWATRVTYGMPWSHWSTAKWSNDIAHIMCWQFGLRQNVPYPVIQVWRYMVTFVVELLQLVSKRVMPRGLRYGTNDNIVWLREWPDVGRWPIHYLGSITRLVITHPRYKGIPHVLVPLLRWCMQWLVSVC